MKPSPTSQLFVLIVHGCLRPHMHTYNTYVIHRCVLSLLANCLCYGEQSFSKRTCCPKVRAIRHLRVRASLLPCRRLLTCALLQGPLLRHRLLKLLKLGHPFWRSLSHRRQHCSSCRHHHLWGPLKVGHTKLLHQFWGRDRGSHRLCLVSFCLKDPFPIMQT